MDLPLSEMDERKLNALKDRDVLLHLNRHFSYPQVSRPSIREIFNNAEIHNDNDGCFQQDSNPCLSFEKALVRSI